MKVNINTKLCKQCKYCVSFCPKKVFDINKDGSIVIVSEENCIGCKQCVLHCPDFAVEVKE